MKNAIIVAKYQRLQEGLSTDVMGVHIFDELKGWSDLPYLEVHNEQAALAGV